MDNLPLVSQEPQFENLPIKTRDKDLNELNVSAERLTYSKRDAWRQLLGVLIGAPYWLHLLRLVRAIWKIYSLAKQLTSAVHCCTFCQLVCSSAGFANDEKPVWPVCDGGILCTCSGTVAEWFCKIRNITVVSDTNNHRIRMCLKFKSCEKTSRKCIGLQDSKNISPCINCLHKFKQNHS